MGELRLRLLNDGSLLKEPENNGKEPGPPDALGFAGLATWENIAAGTVNERVPEIHILYMKKSGKRNGRHEETRTPDLYRVKVQNGIFLDFPVRPWINS